MGQGAAGDFERDHRFGAATESGLQVVDFSRSGARPGEARADFFAVFCVVEIERDDCKSVGGVSLVTNYRDEFNEQIRQGGVDGLIASLAARNKGGAAK